MLIKCCICNKTIEIYPCYIKRVKCCSPKCSHVNRKNFRQSPEAKIKISIAHTGKKLKKSVKIKISKSHLGKKLSRKTREKIRLNSPRGINNHMWRGGRMVRDGYIFIRKPEHPYATSNGYVREHRLVMESKIGRYLKPKEVVHHRNEIRSDNSPENLFLYASNSVHRKDHSGPKGSNGRFIKLSVPVSKACPHQH